MTKISRLALVAMLTLGGAGMIAAPAVAKDKAPAAPKTDYTPKVYKIIVEAQAKIQAGDNAGALAQLREAQAMQKTADDKLAIGQLMLNVGINTNDEKLQEEAINGQIASGKLSAEQRSQYTEVLISRAVKAKDNAKVLALYQQLEQTRPNDPELALSQAETYRQMGNAAQASAGFKRAIDMKKAAGGQVPELWYRLWVQTSYDANLTAEAGQATAGWLSSYPSPQTWRTVLKLTQDRAKFDDSANLDLYRLQRATGSLEGERDWGVYAEVAQQAGLSVEAKSVFDEGVAKKVLVVNKPYLKELQGLIEQKVKTNAGTSAALEKDAKGPRGTGKLAIAAADGYLAEKNYAKAAELYRLALTKGGDAATANTRLGIALSMSGDKAGAEAAFKAVQGNPWRVQLAQYWLVYNGSKA